MSLKPLHFETGDISKRFLENGAEVVLQTVIYRLGDKQQRQKNAIHYILKLGFEMIERKTG